MKITIQREKSSDNSTIGELSIDGVFLCYTLEDIVRLDGVKIPGRTAIPAGIYEIIINFSNRFKRFMCWLLNVPNFESIRIHPGNVAADTEGCILLGRVKGIDYVGESQLAYRDFWAKILEYIADPLKHVEPITVEIINA
jgi:hypothetical protein